MAHKKKSNEGATKRAAILRTVFSEIENHLLNRPSQVGKDDILDAAAAALTALRLHRDEDRRVCEPERDEKGLMACIWY